MCNTVDVCERPGIFWVMTRRPVKVDGNEALDIDPFVTGAVSDFPCGRHLFQSCELVGKINRDAAEGMHTSADRGVIVKRLMPSGEWL